MPKYKIFISFDVRPPDGDDAFRKSFEEITEQKDINAAQLALDNASSIMISEFSDQGFEWTILEKCVEVLNEQKQSDLLTLTL